MSRSSFPALRFLPWAVALAVAMPSCATLGLGDKKAKKEEPSPFGPTGIPPELRRGGPGGSGATPGPSGDKPLIELTDEKDIVYTDPDDWDADIPELSTLLSTAKSGPWDKSEANAKKRSVREGKAMLIWFTDSVRSPMCKALSEELFASHEFGDWANEKIVRLRVDANIPKDEVSQTIDEADTRRYAIRDYTAELKKRYKVLGYPCLIMLNPSGEVVVTHRGYKRGDAQFVWGKLKHAEAVSANTYQGWRSGMEKKGYREWQDRRDRKIFAKLTGYSDGTLTLIEPDGTRSKTKEQSLSDKDRAWIADQKRQRGIQ